MKKIPFSQISKYREHNKKKMLELLERSPSFLLSPDCIQLVQIFRDWSKGWNLYQAVGTEWHRPEAFSSLSNSLPNFSIDFLPKYLRLRSDLASPTALALATRKTAFFSFFLYDKEAHSFLAAPVVPFYGFAVSGDTYPQRVYSDEPWKLTFSLSSSVLKSIEKEGVPPLVNFLDNIDYDKDPNDPNKWIISCSEFDDQIVPKSAVGDFQFLLAEIKRQKDIVLQSLYAEAYGESLFGFSPETKKRRLKKMDEEFDLAECESYNIVAEGEVPDPAWAWFKEHFVPVLL